jgi:hypothetical protein
MRGPTAIVLQDGRIKVRQVGEKGLREITGFYRGILHRQMVEAQHEHERSVGMRPTLEKEQALLQQLSEEHRRDHVKDLLDEDGDFP